MVYWRWYVSIIWLCAFTERPSQQVDRRKDNNKSNIIDLRIICKHRILKAVEGIILFYCSYYQIFLWKCLCKKEVVMFDTNYIKSSAKETITCKQVFENNLGSPLYERWPPSHTFKKDLTLDLKMALIKGTSEGDCCVWNLSFVWKVIDFDHKIIPWN